MNYRLISSLISLPAIEVCKFSNSISGEETDLYCKLISLKSISVKIFFPSHDPWTGLIMISKPTDLRTYNCISKKHFFKTASKLNVNENKMIQKTLSLLIQNEFTSSVQLYFCYQYFIVNTFDNVIIHLFIHLEASLSLLFTCFP